MGIINRLLILLAFILTFLVCLEYKKNKSIKFQEKFENSNRIQEIGSLQALQENINNFNSIVVFCVTWSNYCEEYIKTLEKVSSYKLTLGIEFFKVDCIKHKLDICDVFQISAFPSIKVYLQGKESPHFPPNPDTESILEFVDKINSQQILKLKSHKEILNFSNNYGDSSFMLVRKENEGNSENSYFNTLYDCYEKIAEDINYRPVYYFSEISASKYKKSRNSNEMKFPAIMVI
jgi:thioredoxin-like negative regulator of GroEL